MYPGAQSIGLKKCIVNAKRFEKLLFKTIFHPFSNYCAPQIITVFNFNQINHDVLRLTFADISCRIPQITKTTVFILPKK